MWKKKKTVKYPNNNARVYIIGCYFICAMFLQNINEAQTFGHSLHALQSFDTIVLSLCGVQFDSCAGCRISSVRFFVFSIANDDMQKFYWVNTVGIVFETAFIYTDGHGWHCYFTIGQYFAKMH